MKRLSIIVLTYNSEWKKLKATLLSLIFQKEISLELIIADDGSSEQYDEKIRDLCKYYGKEVKFSNLKSNAGTIKNIACALKMVTTTYVKLISPGDIAFGVDSFSRWIQIIEESDADLSFGDAVYYGKENGCYKVLRHLKAPVQGQLYEGKNRRKLMVDCLMANDNILGASIIIKTELLERYIALFEGKVKYAEDYLVRLAVFEGKKILYYSQNVIWYEYGMGISTNKNDKWRVLLYKDFVASNRLIANECKATDKISKKYVSYLISEDSNPIVRKVKKCLLFPDVIVWRLKNRNSKNYTDINVDIKQLQSYFGELI